MTIIYTVIVAVVLAFVLGFALGAFKKIFAVHVDEKVEQIRSALPGVNCGGCGFPGCDGFASACAKGDAPANGCVAGGVEVAKQISKILGVDAQTTRKVAFLCCQGDCENAVLKGDFVGPKKCSVAKASINGTKMCNFACIGFGDCVAVCKFDAIKIGENGLPIIDEEKCVGCGMCAKTCPQGVLKVIVPTGKTPIARCSNRSENKVALLKNCKKSCIKCGKCEKSCESDAIHLVKGIPEVDAQKCTSCGKCVEGCPTKVLVWG